MVTRSKKTLPKIKFLQLNYVITFLNSRRRNMWLVFKQVWFVLFIWSMTWYMFWILRDVAIFNKSLIECNVFNYIGATISISALILALISYGTIKIKKKILAMRTNIRIKIGRIISFGNIDRKIFQLKSSFRQIPKNIRIKKPNQLKSQIESNSPVERSCVEKLDETNQKRKKPYADVTAFSRSINNSGQVQVPQEIASECLTCPNLIHCDYRQNKSTKFEDKIQKPSCCRFGKDLSSERNIQS